MTHPDFELIEAINAELDARIGKPMDDPQIYVALRLRLFDAVTQGKGDMIADSLRNFFRDSGMKDGYPRDEDIMCAVASALELDDWMIDYLSEFVLAMAYTLSNEVFDELYGDIDIADEAEIFGFGGA